MKKTEILYKDLVLREIAGGMTCEQVIKQHPEVSMYYARKWSGDVYRNKDLSHYVRDRYKWIVVNAAAGIEDLVIETISRSGKVPEKEWTACFRKIHFKLYDMIEDVIKKN